MIGVQMRQHDEIDRLRRNADGAETLRQLTERRSHRVTRAGIAKNQSVAMTNEKAIYVERQRLAMGNPGQALALGLVDADDDVVSAVEHAVRDSGHGELTDDHHRRR